MDIGFVSIIAGTGGILKSDLWETIKKRMHEDSPNLGKSLVILVQAKTPVLSGSLLSDMTYEPYTSTNTDDLVFVYAEGTAQQAYWKRIYVQYQEGDPLGLPTYTNPPREMFYMTSITDGLETVQVWALEKVFEANELSVLGLGVPWVQPTP